jgi:hypothetical protein
VKDFFLHRPLYLLQNSQGNLQQGLFFPIFIIEEEEHPQVAHFEPPGHVGLPPEETHQSHTAVFEAELLLQSGAEVLGGFQQLWLFGAVPLGRLLLF